MADAFCRFVDALNERLGSVARWVLFLLVFIILYEVVARYFFNAPTIWSWDVAFHFQALVVLLVGGYLVLHDGHIRVDIFFAKFSRRTQRLIDLVTAPAFFLGYGLLLWRTVVQVVYSYERAEFLPDSFEPLTWPVQALIAVGVFLLLLQGVAKFIRDLQAVITGDYPQVEGGQQS